jgi:hypothetical protein
VALMAKPSWLISEVARLALLAPCHQPNASS